MHMSKTKKLFWCHSLLEVLHSRSQLSDTKLTCYCRVGRVHRSLDACSSFCEHKPVAGRALLVLIRRVGRAYLLLNAYSYCWARLPIAGRVFPPARVPVGRVFLLDVYSHWDVFLLSAHSRWSVFLLGAYSHWGVFQVAYSLGRVPVGRVYSRWAHIPLGRVPGRIFARACSCWALVPVGRAFLLRAFLSDGCCAHKRVAGRVSVVLPSCWTFLDAYS
jgi:hypothetical protein